MRCGDGRSDPRNGRLDQALIDSLLLSRADCTRDEVVTAMRLSRDQDDVHEIVEAIAQLKRHAKDRNAPIPAIDDAEFYEDDGLLCLKNELDHKRKLLVAQRGSARMRRNKWMTHISDS